MTDTAIHIEAKDCLAIPSQPEIGSIMHTLLNIEQTQVFHFSMNHDEELKEPIVEFDYRIESGELVDILEKLILFIMDNHANSR